MPQNLQNKSESVTDNKIENKDTIISVKQENNINLQNETKMKQVQLTQSIENPEIEIQKEKNQDYKQLENKIDTKQLQNEDIESMKKLFDNEQDSVPIVQSKEIEISAQTKESKAQKTQQKPEIAIHEHDPFADAQNEPSQELKKEKSSNQKDEDDTPGYHSHIDFHHDENEKQRKNEQPPHQMPEMVINDPLDENDTPGFHSHTPDFYNHEKEKKHNIEPDEDSDVRDIRLATQRELEFVPQKEPTPVKEDFKADLKQLATSTFSSSADFIEKMSQKINKKVPPNSVLAFCQKYPESNSSADEAKDQIVDRLQDLCVELGVEFDDGDAFLEAFLKYLCISDKTVICKLGTTLFSFDYDQEEIDGLEIGLLTRQMLGGFSKLMSKTWNEW